MVGIFDDSYLSRCINEMLSRHMFDNIRQDKRKRTVDNVRPRHVVNEDADATPFTSYEYYAINLVKSLGRQTGKTITYDYKIVKRDCIISATYNGHSEDIITVKFGQTPESIIEIHDLSYYSSFDFILHYPGTVSIWKSATGSLYSYPKNAKLSDKPKAMFIRRGFNMPEYIRLTDNTLNQPVYNTIDLNNVPMKFDSYTTLKTMVQRFQEKGFYVQSVNPDYDYIFIDDKRYSTIAEEFDNVLLYFQDTSSAPTKVFTHIDILSNFNYDIGVLDTMADSAYSINKLVCFYLACLIKTDTFLPTYKRSKEII